MQKENYWRIGCSPMADAVVESTHIEDFGSGRGMRHLWCLLSRHFRNDIEAETDRIQPCLLTWLPVFHFYISTGTQVASVFLFFHCVQFTYQRVIAGHIFQMLNAYYNTKLAIFPDRVDAIFTRRER
jgi:hypothetical protein